MKPVQQAETTGLLSGPDDIRKHNFLHPRFHNDEGLTGRTQLQPVSFAPHGIEDYACPNADLEGILLLGEDTTLYGSLLVSTGRD